MTRKSSHFQLIVNAVILQIDVDKDFLFWGEKGKSKNKKGTSYILC